MVRSISARLDTADAKDCRFGAGDVDDRRLDADATGSAVEDDGHVGAEIGTYMRGGGRARRDRIGSLMVPRLPRRTTRGAAVQPDGPVLARPTVSRPAVSSAATCVEVASDDDRERSRPVRLRELAGRGGHVAGQVVELAGVAEVHDDGMIGGPAFDGVQATHGVGIRRVGAESVDRLGRERDEVAGAQSRDGTRGDHRRRVRAGFTSSVSHVMQFRFVSMPVSDQDRAKEFYVECWASRAVPMWGSVRIDGGWISSRPAAGRVSRW